VKLKNKQIKVNNINIKNMKIKKIIGIIAFTFVFMSAFVQFTSAVNQQDADQDAYYAYSQRFSCRNLLPNSSVGDIINMGTCILLKSVVPLLFALAIVAFVWGIIQYFLNPENEEKKKKGKSYMIWGLIALFVMVTMWALVAVLSDTFFGEGNGVFVPQLSQTLSN
jgi:succinate dehydrogenase/fumarate reductase cytochrome b subunit